MSVRAKATGISVIGGLGILPSIKSRDFAAVLA